MRILLTNDDGYDAKGLQSLVKVLEKYGELLVVAPKSAQSGMSMAVTMGRKPIAVKHLGKRGGNQDWWYLDGTPASCVKYGIDNILCPAKPDLVVSGINHGSNAATAAIYSGTVGAAMEGAVNGIPSLAISLDSFDPDADFSAIEALLPGLLDRLLPAISGRFGEFYNINFPNLPASGIKGVKAATMGMGHWEKEYEPYDETTFRKKNFRPRPSDLEYLAAAEPGEEMVVMVGDFISNEGNAASADHLLLADGWITVTPQNIDNTDSSEHERLCGII